MLVQVIFLVEASLPSDLEASIVLVAHGGKHGVEEWARDSTIWAIKSIDSIRDDQIVVDSGTTIDKVVQIWNKIKIDWESSTMLNRSLSTFLMGGHSVNSPQQHYLTI